MAIRRSLRTYPAIRFLLFCLTACAGDGSEVGFSLATASDSAGVVIVEYPGSIRDLPIAFRISESFRLDLGGERSDPSEEIDTRAPFIDAIRLPDGGYVVTSHSDMKVFDDQGRYRVTLGRQGDGPGEFGQVRAACVLPGGEILVIHYSRPTVSVFDVTGTHLRTFTAQGATNIEGSGCLGDGSVLALRSPRPDPEFGPNPHPHMVATFIRVAADGSEVGTIGTLPVEAMSLYPELTGNVVPHGEEIYVGNGVSPELRVYRIDGTLIRIIRWNESLVPLTQEVFEGLVRGSVPMNAPPGQFESILQRASMLPRLETLPVYSQIRLDAAGRIWIQDHRDTSDAGFPYPWTVLDPSGEPLGRVVLPELPARAGTVRLGSIGRDEVALVWRDDTLGFAHVTFHALERVDSP